MRQRIKELKGAILQIAQNTLPSGGKINAKNLWRYGGTLITNLPLYLRMYRAMPVATTRSDEEEISISSLYPPSLLQDMAGQPAMSPGRADQLRRKRSAIAAGLGCPSPPLLTGEEAAERVRSAAVALAAVSDAPEVTERDMPDEELRQYIRTDAEVAAIKRMQRLIELGCDLRDI